MLWQAVHTQMHGIRFSNSTEMASAANKDNLKEMKTVSLNSHNNSISELNIYGRN
jgi:L-2-hydroxyglutarate oxidase LhgO